MNGEKHLKAGAKRTWRTVAFPMAFGALTLCSAGQPISEANASDQFCPAIDTDLAPNEAGSFTLVSMNIKSLPWYTDPGKGLRKGRIECMGALAGAYDVALAQEAFAKDRSYFRASNHKHQYADVFKGLINDPGLTISAKQTLHQTSMEAYPSCHGWLNAKNDCFARKGLQRARITTAFGTVSIINTHLDAGQTAKDQAVRRESLETIRKNLPADKSAPVIIAGDYNFKEGNKYDFLRWLHDEGFRIAIDDQADIIAYRGENLRALDSAVIPLEDLKLSDHNGVSARFTLAPEQP